MESFYLKWKDYIKGNKYNLGALIKDRKKGMYYFKIDANKLEKAVSAGLNAASLPFLPNKIYKSSKLFSFFKMRIPAIEKLNQKQLTKTELDEFDDFDYLRKTKGKISIDNFMLEESK